MRRDERYWFPASGRKLWGWRFGAEADRCNTMADQRRFPRARLSFDSDVWVERPSGPTHFAGRFVVLGEGGACLELDGTLFHRQSPRLVV